MVQSFNTCIFSNVYQYHIQHWRKNWKHLLLVIYLLTWQVSSFADLDARLWITRMGTFFLQMFYVNVLQTNTCTILCQLNSCSQVISLILRISYTKLISKGLACKLCSIMHSVHTTTFYPKTKCEQCRANILF